VEVLIQCEKVGATILVRMSKNCMNETRRLHVVGIWVNFWNVNKATILILRWPESDRTSPQRPEVPGERSALPCLSRSKHPSGGLVRLPRQETQVPRRAPPRLPLLELQWYRILWRVSMGRQTILWRVSMGRQRHSHHVHQTVGRGGTPVKAHFCLLLFRRRRRVIHPLCLVALSRRLTGLFDLSQSCKSVTLKWRPLWLNVTNVKPGLLLRQPTRGTRRRGPGV